MAGRPTGHCLFAIGSSRAQKHPAVQIVLAVEMEESAQARRLSALCFPRRADCCCRIVVIATGRQCIVDDRVVLVPLVASLVLALPRRIELRRVGHRIERRKVLSHHARARALNLLTPGGVLVPKLDERDIIVARQRAAVLRRAGAVAVAAVVATTAAADSDASAGELQARRLAQLAAAAA
eukprot:6615265-Prymnesium_polylepis.1